MFFNLLVMILQQLNHKTQNTVFKQFKTIGHKLKTTIFRYLRTSL